jgi:hypothetical protein
MAAAPCGRPGKAGMPWTRTPLRAHRRSSRTRVRVNGKILSSKRRILERKKAAAEACRKANKTREGLRNSSYQKDFEAREPPHATASFAKAEHLSCLCPSRYGRRTSLRGEAEEMLPVAPSITQQEWGTPLRPAAWPTARNRKRTGSARTGSSHLCRLIAARFRFRFVD